MAEPLEPRLLLSAQLVRDLVPGSDGGQPRMFTPFGERLAFSTSGSQPGLWVSDGTDTGTTRVFPGQVGFDTYEFRGGAAATSATGATTLFFGGPDGLWKTDGTATGTSRVRQFDPQPNHGPELYSFTESGGVTYFTARTQWYGEELWRTDGTADGTMLVKDLNPGGADGRLRNLVNGNGTLFFTASPPNLDGIWKSDGTPAGTVLVKGYDNSGIQAEPGLLTNVSGRLFFSARDAAHGHELWTSDGTAEGTRRLTDLRPGALDSLYGLSSLIALGDLLLFTARGADGTTGLWRSDGTESGTTLVAALPQPAFDVVPGPLVAAGPLQAYFMSDGKLWKSDGTPAGTTALMPLPSVTSRLTFAGGRLYFNVADGAGEELWTSDGTPAGTARVDDINPGPAGSSPLYLTEVDGRLYFSAKDSEHGNELWKINLTAAAPAAPAGLVATALSGGEISLHWADASASEAGFTIERSTSPDFAQVSSPLKLLPDTTSYLAGGLAAGTTYYFRVSAFNRAGPSAGVTASATTPVAPAAPAALRASAVSHTRVDLAWTDNASDELGFRVERSRVSTFSTTDATFTVGADVTTLSDTTVSPETHYFYRVSAVGPAGRSAAARAHVLVAGPPPSGLRAWGVSGNRIDLEWTNPPVSGPFGVSIERAGPGEEFSEIERQPATAPYFGDVGRRPSTEYRYRVRTIGPAGLSAPSNEATAVTAPPVLATLVKDLNTTDIVAGSGASEVVMAGGVGYFAAEDEVFGRELWRTDGTSAGTRRVTDLNPGRGNGLFAYDPSTGDMLAVGNLLYFLGIDGSSGAELWRTDGTEPGTVRVADAVPGVGGVAPSFLTYINGTIFFVGGPLADRELWATDGTAAGTRRVRDIYPGPEGSAPQALVAWNGTLYFSATDGLTGRELWRSDGTQAGTYRVADVTPGAADSAPAGLTPANGILMFSARDPDGGRELWKTNGTAAGTARVRDILPGEGSSSPDNLFASNGRLLFSTGLQLWVSDGTEAGTTMLRDFAPASPPGNPGAAPHAFGSAASVTYFVTTDAGLVRLWRTDNTTAGTTLVAEIDSGNPGTADGIHLTELNGALYFFALQPGGWRLWKSNGTAAGTASVTPPLPESPGVGRPAAVGDAILFPAGEGSGGYGAEMWRTDGTEAGTTQLVNIRVINGDGFPDNLTTAAGAVFFTTSQETGMEPGLWRSDGSAAGTTMIRPGFATNLVATSNRIFFLAAMPDAGLELWTSDGTPAGTVLVKDLTPGPVGSVIPGLVAAPDGTVYFASRAADSGNFAYKLWRSDGTPGGTILLSDAIVGADPEFNPGPFLMPAGGNVYFRASDSGTGSELWKTDGTPGGTTLVKDIYPGPAGSVPTRLANVNGTLYFWAGDLTGQHIFRSDGTLQGTARVDVIAGAELGSIPVAFNNLLVFQSRHPQFGIELWRSDGTPEGTYVLGDLNPGPDSGAASDLTVLDNTLYFVATSAGGRALWKTDGTAAGTTRIRALDERYAGPTFSMFDANGTLFYIDAGFLWKSDGSRAGTQQVLAVADNAPQRHAVAPGAIFLRGYDREHGFELWSVATDAPAAPDTPTGLILADGTTRVTWQDRSANEVGFLVDRLAGGTGGATSAVPAAGDVVERTFFVGANDTTFIDSTPGGIYRYRIRAVNAAGESAPTAAVTPSGVPHSSVTGRYALDGGTAAAAGKFALRPGSAATSSNILTGSRGITGVMIDVAGLPPGTSPGAADFALDIGTGGTWSALAASPTVTISRGGGAAGADRVTLTLPDGLARNSWLRVTVKATATTGLASPDVFYFGNLPGETANDRGAPTVNATDYTLTRAAVFKTDAASLNSFDFNRDGKIDAADVLIVRNNQRHSLAPFTAPPAVAPAQAPAAAAQVPAARGRSAARPARRSAWEELTE